MSVTAKGIRDQFHETYPSDYFYVCKFTAPGGVCGYNGNNLLDAQLDDEDWLQVYKLMESSGSKLNDDEIRQKALPFVYDTKDITDGEMRRDRLREDLKMVFPEHNVNVFLYKNKWSYASWSKGCFAFLNAYGLDVVIVLS